MRLRLEDDNEVDARIKGKRMKPVCGDRVVAEPIDDESDWLITTIHERQNSLTRPNMRGQTEVLAANVELLIVVSAGTPDPDWFIVDRYLSAAENMGVPAVVVHNKIDLEPATGKSAVALNEYAGIGYPTLRCSATTAENIDLVQDAIGQSIAIIVGQSGVGKSTIINGLVDNENQKTASISDKTGEGKHTTVNSMMITLPGGGAIIDSPGVRDFAPALRSAPEVILGFREIEKAGHDCRFANCRHLREPGCAVKAAVEEDSISARRYESYRRLLALTEKLERKI